MNKSIRFLSVLFALCSVLYISAADAACSKQNFHRCLDSACAINIGMNPAARCQLCGDASAGDAKDKGLSNVSVGASARYTLSASELKSLRDAPDERYVDAVKACGAKVEGCSIDDTDDYDKLIAQSCRAAGINTQMAIAAKNANVKKTEDACRNEIRACIIDEKRCGRDWLACKENADFDRNFSSCTVIAAGCSDFAAGIRTGLVNSRDSSFKNAADVLESLVAGFKAKREARLIAARDSCKDNASRDACVKQICATNMRNDCTPGSETERIKAGLLCKYHETACSKLKTTELDIQKK